MKAVVRHAYGGPEALRFEEVPAPTPGPRDVLVRVRAASVNAMDAHMLLGRPAVARLFTGLVRPRDGRIGVDLAGEVVAVGEEVRRFRPGDAVFGVARGAFAELACAAEGKLARMPPALSFDGAASIPVAGSTALQGLRDAGRVAPGRKVLVLGAGGGVGSFAVQIARAVGADVTAVTRAEHVERIRALGVREVFDRAAGDPAAGDAGYDCIFDLGGIRGFGALHGLLAAEGRVVAAGVGGLGRPTLGGMTAWGGRIAGGLLRSRLGRRKLVFTMAAVRPDDLDLLARWVEAGTLRPPVTARFPLAGAADAMHALLGGRTGGKIVILP
ncbi:MAG: NAD(P)-dependent alcohol dehydrogenase [Alphaproteobacteria bacterium]|nr:NAD(P)-dependent alcohol dehydrogenase [Alphaproteobacteria bacterium]